MINDTRFAYELIEAIEAIDARTFDNLISSKHQQDGSAFHVNHVFYDRNLINSVRMSPIHAVALMYNEHHQDESKREILEAMCVTLLQHRADPYTEMMGEYKRIYNSALRQASFEFVNGKTIAQRCKVLPAALLYEFNQVDDTCGTEKSARGDYNQRASARRNEAKMLAAKKHLEEIEKFEWTEDDCAAA